MSSHINSRPFIALFSIFALFVIAAVAVRAEHGRNFAGSYHLTDVADHGTIVKFDLHVKIFNFSGADVNGASVSLGGRTIQRDADAADYQGAFNDVSIPYRKFVELSGTFTAPAREFHEWERGAVPNLVVTYMNDEGKETRSRVELRPDPGAMPRPESR